MCKPFSVPTWHEKTGVWSLLLHDNVWRELRALLFEEWNFRLDIRLGSASTVKGLLGTLIGRSFFGAAACLFVLDRLYFFWQKPFLASISGRPLLLFHQAKPKIASFSSLEPKRVFFGVCGRQFHLACVVSGRMRAEWVSAALLWFYKHDSGS